MREFKVGDIVYHRSGRICNGLFGEIHLAPEGDGTLCVCDNEGALDMDVEPNKDDLIVVGNVENNRNLLNIFANNANANSLLIEALKETNQHIERMYAMQVCDSPDIQASRKCADSLVQAIIAREK